MKDHDGKVKDDNEIKETCACIMKNHDGKVKDDGEFQFCKFVEPQAVPAHYSAKGTELKMQRLDYLIMLDPETKHAAQYFANDNDQFLRQFSNVWTKMMIADRFDGPIGNVCSSKTTQKVTCTGRKDRNTCIADTACRWNGKRKACEAKTADVDCDKLTRKNTCKANEMCQWDEKIFVCLIAGNGEAEA